MRRHLTTTLLLFLVVFVVALVRGAPPEPLGDNAPRDHFSATRAREVQKLVAGDGQPRPSGSPANLRAVEALARKLESIGWHPEIQKSFSCGRWGTCGSVFNIVSKKEGKTPDAASVLIAAHYDSVPAGPGASDDGLGVAAVVEVARALSEGPLLDRTVVLVLTDSEENGLLGAEAFFREHPFAKNVRAAVNVDARGSSGPSQMFETSAGNAWVLDLVARELPRPVTSSLFYEIYRRMPNDTDFSVWKSRAAGVNFANVARIADYHTTRDTVENSDLGTLQHHGDHVLAMTRAFGNAKELEHPPPGDAVWFDVLAMFVVKWPVTWTMPLAGAALLLIVVHAVRLRAWTLGLLGGLTTLLLAGVSAFAFGLVLRAGGALVTPWMAYPTPVSIALHTAAIAGGILGTIALCRACTCVTPSSLWAGVWIVWGLLGVALARVAPGASHVFVVPTLVAGIVAFAGIERASVAGALVAAVFWMPMLAGVVDALGFRIPVVACIGTIVLLSTLPPVLTGVSRRTPLAFGAVAIAATLAATTVPHFSVDRPQRVNVIHSEDASSTAKVFVAASWGPAKWGDPPAAMVHALGAFAPDEQSPIPWSSLSPYGNAPSLALPAPELEILASATDGQERHVHARLHSARGAPTIVLEIAGDHGPVVAHGYTATWRSNTIIFRATPPEGVEIELSLPAGPVEAMLSDISSGVPPGSLAAKVVSARPPEAVPSQEGDVTVVKAHAKL